MRATAEFITDVTGVQALTEQHIINRRRHMDDPQEDQETQRQNKPEIPYVDSKGTRRHLDVAVVTPHAGSLRNCLAVRKPGEVSRLEENEKVRKYHSLLLTPIIFEHLGRPGKGVRDFISHLTCNLGPADRSSVIQDFWQSISVVLQKGNVNLVRAAAPTALT